MLFGILLAVPAMAQKKQQEAPIVPDRTRVLLILDCSNSMWDRWQSNAKIKVVQQVLLHFMDSVANQSDVEVALRVFGHLNKDQFGTKLEVPFGPDNNAKIQSKIKTLVPQGGCTVATALTDALHDFPRTGTSRNIILIITDGMDDCDAAICNVARQVQLSGVVVQTFILGIGDAGNFGHSMDCAGRFSHVPDEEQMDEKLYEVFRLSDQMAQVVLEVRDSQDQLQETEIPVAFYDGQTHVVKHATIYSMGAQGVADTLELDPLVSYDITLFTRPVITLKNRQFVAGEVNKIGVKADMGSLRVRRSEKRVSWTLPNYQVLVRKAGSSEILATQMLGDELQYREGSYDLEVLSMPHLRLEGVEVQAQSKTDLEIPMPGILLLAKPKVVSSGSIFAMEEGRLHWVCDLNPNAISERIVLLPGEYMLVIHPEGAADYQKVQNKRFSIESAQQTSVTVN